jgi:type VI secretion system VgrG family protein
MSHTSLLDDFKHRVSFFNRRFSFSCDELGSDTAMEVVRFEGEESLGGLYRFEILLVSASNDIDEQKLLGQPAIFLLNDGVPGGEDTCYSGLITAFEQQHRITGWTFYKAVLQPKFWRLGQFHLTEVYLNKTPKELLEIILDAGGLSSNDYNLAYLQPGAYPQQKFVCQYRESYLSFITRWCEHLGVYWWYVQQQDGEQIVFGNNYRNHDPHVVSLRYQPAGELDADVTGARRVQLFNVFSQPLPRQVTVSNYFYQKASLQIKGSAIVSEQGIGEVNYYGMHAESNEIAENIARIRAEGLICRGRQFSGESTATGLRCGHFLELSDHYRASFNRKYLLTRVSHRGSQASLLLAGLGVQMTESDEVFYHAEFSSIPSDVQFRPELLHPWPRIEGTLVAFIDAEGSGKYAELNEEGEYKVQLPYYISEKDPTKASAWIRMASPYAGTDDAGSAHGMHFPLHKGAEVLLSFHNGNPDKPVIIGAVANSQTPNVVTNENQTQSRIQTAGGNEITMHDEAGKQHMLFKTPTGNTWLRMGSGGFDPKASSYAYSSKTGHGGMQQQWQAPPSKLPWRGMEQAWQGGEARSNISRQQQQATPTPEPDGSYDFTGNAADGLTMATDGQFTLNAQQDVSINSITGNVSISADNGDGSISMESSSNQKTTYGDEKSHIHGDVNNHVYGTQTEIVNGPWQEIGSMKNEIYGTATHGTPLSICLYGMAFNVYGTYINKYGFRLDSANARVDTAGIRLEYVDLKLSKIPALIQSGQIAINNNLTDLKFKKVDVESVGLCTSYQQMLIREQELAAVKKGVSIKQCRADINSALVVLGRGPHIFS